MTRKEHLLTILMEECNEVSQRCSKALRFGLKEVQEGQPHDNAERIAQEVDDLLGVLMLCHDEILFRRSSSATMHDKMIKVESYLQYSKQQGTLI